MFRNEDTKHILLECPETKKWRTEMLCKRYLSINEEVAYKKMLSCTNKMTVKNMGRFLFRIQ
jgi:HKD family nuclease